MADINENAVSDWLKDRSIDELLRNRQLLTVIPNSRAPRRVEQIDREISVRQMRRLDRLDSMEGRRPEYPESALDYPDLPDNKWVLWSGNEHLWPSAKRETHYISRNLHPLTNTVKWTINWSEAAQFDTMAQAEIYADRCVHPEQLLSVRITTVETLKKLRGFS